MRLLRHATNGVDGPAVRPQSSTFNGLPPRSEVWLARFCAPPEQGGCGNCPRHCQCDRTRIPTRQDLTTRRTPQ